MNSLRLRSILFAAISVLIAIGIARLAPPGINAQSTPPDVILLASTARLAGAWRVLSISGAAGGTAAVLPNTGRAKALTPLAKPTDYFELTFNVAANVPYRLWIRGRADGNLNTNDSVHVQFTNSVDSAGVARWRIGSTSSAVVNLEDCSGCGNSGWGWEDNGWGSVGALGPQIRFATSGAQTLRVQNREDGFYIDQIVLSASTYLTSSPGANKNDTTILVGGSTSLTVVRQPYFQQVTDNTAIVVWATRQSGPATARVNGRTFNAVSTRFSAARTGFTYDYYQHEATITGLSAGTPYLYELRVNSQIAASGSSIRTAPAAGAIRFIAFGDSGIGSTAQQTLASRMSADAWDFALHLGDIAYGSSTTSGDATYKTYQAWFFDIYRDWLKRKPFYPSMGNHDSRSTNNNGQAYLDLFVLPDQAGAGAYPDHAERYYSFDYGPVHFVALDTEFAFQDPTRRQAQVAWLRSDLSSTSSLWKVAFWHRAPYSAKGEHGSDLAVRQAFGPVMEQYGVQLALTAHEHNYERTVPWRESTNRALQAVTYVVSGGGGARLYPAGIASWTAYSRSDYHYLRVYINGCVLRTENVDRYGVVRDPFTLDRCAQASDAGAPTVRVTSPASGARLSGVVTLTASATDDVRVEKVDFRIDGVLRAIDRTATYSYTWDSRTVAAGTHTIQARAYDIDGNRVSSTTVTVTTTGT
jgi:acid phosphatase type 7